MIIFLAMNITANISIVIIKDLFRFGNDFFVFHIIVIKERLKSSLRKFYGRYGDLTRQYEVPLSLMLHDILDDVHIQ